MQTSRRAWGPVTSIRKDQSTIETACDAGAPLTGDAWVARLRTPLQVAVAEEKNGYDVSFPDAS